MMSSRRDEEFCRPSEQNNICRLCGQCKSDIIAIFSDEAHRKHVLLKIQTRLLIQISASDPLPKNACNDCLEKLDSLWDFFELCRKTQITLRGKFLNERRGERVTLREQTIVHQGSVGTSHPPRCTLKSITHRTTQDTLDGASENKKMKLENVPLIKNLKEELVCLDENNPSSVTSSAGSRESYQKYHMEIGAESSQNSNISARSDHQQGSDNIVNKLCVSEMVDAGVRRSMTILKNCDMGEVRSSICLSVKKSNRQKAASSDLEDNSLGLQQGFQNVLKTKPIIDKNASVNCINSSAVHEDINRSSPVISMSCSESDENMLSHRKDSLLASPRTEGGRHSSVVSFVSGSEIQRGVSLTGAENSVVQQVEENISRRSTLSCGKNQEAVQQITADSSLSSLENICQAGILSSSLRASHVQVEKGKNNMLGSLLCIPENVEKERRDTLQKKDADIHATKSVIQEGTKSVTLEEKDQISASNNAGGLSRSSGASQIQKEKDENNVLGSSLCIHGNLEKEKRETLQKEDTDIHATKSVTQEGPVEKDENNVLGSSLLIHGNLEKEKRETIQKEDTDTHATKSVTQEGPVEKDENNVLGSSLLIHGNLEKEKRETIQKEDTDTHATKSVTQEGPVEKDENNVLGSSLLIHGNLEKEKRETIQKEDTDTHATKSVTQEGIKCNIQEVKDKISASNNTVSLSDAVNSYGRLHDDDDDDGDSDSSDCVDSFTCHDCGNNFSCKNSLTDHIFKQHMPVRQTNSLHAAPPTIVALKCSDSSVNKLSPSDVGLVNSANIKCNIQEEKDKLLASSNTVYLSDPVNSYGKLHDDDDDDDGGSDISDCVDSFACHDCGNNFSCKNSLTDHIFKQHMPAGQTNSLHAAPPTIVALKCSDSSINKLSRFDVGSVHSANTSDGVLIKMETVSNSVQSQDKPVEEAQTSSCKVHSVDDNGLVVYDSTSNNKSCVKPLQTELKPTTVEKAILMCEKYAKRICETSGEYPKINMINIKVELPSGDFYTDTNSSYRKIFKPFIVLQDSRYDCQICKATLNTRISVVKHIGEHFNLFPYCCNICGKRYTILKNVNEHIRLHLTKLICEQCGAVCSSSTGYTSHMRVHNKPYSCHDCGERFGSKGRMRDHIWKEHMNIRSYVCKLCGKAYFHPGNVSTHMVFAHAERKIVCQYCGKMYFRNNMLKQHIKRWHT